LQVFGARFEAGKREAMGLWRGFGAKKRAQRHGKIAAYELISAALAEIG
jgi:hypothetical protein